MNPGDRFTYRFPYQGKYLDGEGIYPEPGASYVRVAAEHPNAGTVAVSVVLNDHFHCTAKPLVRVVSRLSLIPGEPAEWSGVFEYPSKGRYYYRYIWGKGSKTLGQAHIPGGSTKSRTATSRANQVRQAIAQGQTPNEICTLIKKMVVRKAKR